MKIILISATSFVQCDFYYHSCPSYKSFAVAGPIIFTKALVLWVLKRNNVDKEKWNRKRRWICAFWVIPQLKGLIFEFIVESMA